MRTASYFAKNRNEIATFSDFLEIALINDSDHHAPILVNHEGPA
jgi:hypothetical protein